MRVITIIVPADGDPEPPTVHLLGINAREASMACWEACEVLYAEVAGMIVERSEP